MSGTMRWLAVLVTAVASVGIASPAFACLCVGRTDAEAVNAAQVVFTGTAVGFEVAEEQAASDELVTWRFRVEAVQKGAVAINEDVTTPPPGGGGGDCPSPDFAVGHRFRVFADRRDGRLHAGDCSPTHPTDEVRGRPVGAVDEVHGGGPWSATVWSLATAGVLLVGGLSAARLVGRRRAGG